MADGCELRLCGVADLDVEPGTVDAIITDPPYPREFLPQWSELAEFAAHALKPGGNLIAMSGHLFLDEIIHRFYETDGLVYRWTLACMTPGGNARIWPRKLYQGWKPMLWYTNGGGGVAAPERWLEDRIVSTPDKRYHEWGQDVAVFNQLVLGFSAYGDLVCDPFLGGGTTAVSALLHGRRFIGCDTDEAAVRKSTARAEGAAEYVRAQKRDRQPDYTPAA